MSVEKGPQQDPAASAGRNVENPKQHGYPLAFRPAEAADMQDDRIRSKHWAANGARSLLSTDPIRITGQNLSLSFQEMIA